MTEFEEIAKVNQRGTTLLSGLTAKLHEGTLQPAPGGGFIAAMTPPPIVLNADGTPMPRPAMESHVLIGNSLLATFPPNDRKDAEELVDEVNKSLEPLRKKLKTRFMADLRKIVG
jgi:hypothetical protein